MKKNYFIVCLAIIAMTHVANAAQLSPLKGTGTLTDITSNLELFLKFNETSGTNANDETTNNNDGTLRSLASFATGGHEGGCVNFTGANDSEITVSGNASINNPSTITVNIWFKPASKDISGPILQKREYSPLYELSYQSYSYDSQIKFGLNGVTPNNISSGFDYNGSTVLDWHMLTGTYDGSTIKIYLDGAIANSVDATGTITTNNDPLWIGGAIYGSHFIGKLDEPRIYSRALSADDVLALYNASVAASTIPDAPTSVSATAGSTQATVAFTAPANNGGAAITGYTVTSSPGGNTATGTSSPLTVTGLTNGIAYTFTVTATNSAGTSATSNASNSVTPAASTGTDITSNLALFLKFNETSGTNANDETTNNNDGTLRSLASFATGGHEGGCVNFTGEEYSDITVADNASLNTTAAITVSIWYNAPVSTTDGKLIMKQRYNAAYELSYSNKNYDAAQRNVTFTMINLGSVSATFDAGNTGEGSGAWHMATGTYDGTTMKIYLDGVLASSFAVTGTVPVNNSTLWIGSSEYGGQFKGKLDEPRIYSRALSAEDVAALYALNTTTLVSTAKTSTELGLNASSVVNVTNTGSLTIDAPVTISSIAIQSCGKVTNSSTLTANVFNINSDANGTGTYVDNGTTTITGGVNVQQYLTVGRNWYISSPVQVTNSPANNITRYYEYVEAGDNADLSITGSTAYWKGLNTGTSMTVGKGYIAQASAETTVQFSGTPNNGNITTNFNLTRDDAKGKGFNLVGNPYPSYIDWNLVAAANTNLMSTVWFKTKKSDVAGGGYTFASVNVTTPSSPEIVANNANTTITKYIPPTQAFWVRVKSGTSSTSMSFTNAMREHCLNNGDLMKAPKVNERSRIRLQLVNGIESDETLIYFDKIATNDFNEYDSPKMMNNSSITPDLYTKSGVERLVINGLNAVTDNLELPLGFSLNTAASLKLKATEMSNFPIGMRIYLLDKVESSQVELLPETEYSFNTTTATNNNESRFCLIFRAPGTVNAVDKTNILDAQVYVSATNQINIIAPEKSIYSIYNALGQKLNEGNTNSNRTIVSGSHQAGMYIVRVSENGKELTNKVIIK